jgi:hypothetical protein
MEEFCLFAFDDIASGFISEVIVGYGDTVM